ncbi:MAG: tetratricopeptide repeat protein [Chloroflexi bacterium]|nr:tetratricopeptide repeat protein [Chloroflexota bacterium]
MTNPVVNMVQEIRTKVRKDLYGGTLNYDATIALLKRQVSVAEKMKDLLLLGQIYETMGTIELELGNYELGNEHYQKSLEAFETIEDSFRVGIMLNNIGEIYRRWGKPHEAAANYVRARQLAEEAEEPRLVITAYSNEGQVWLAFGEIDKGIDLLEKGLETANRYADWDRNTVSATVGQALPEIRSNLAEAYASKGDFDKAWEHAQRALDAATEFKHLDQVARATQAMASIAMLQNTGEHDIPALLASALETWQKVGAKVDIAHLSKMEGDYWISQRDLEKANIAYQRAIEYFDEVRLTHEADTLREKLAIK